MKFNVKSIFKRKRIQSADPTVQNYVESFFDPIRYSREVAESKKKIIETLEPVYASMKAENESDAFRAFVADYPDLGALLAAAGIDRAKAAEWQERKADVTYDDFRARFDRRRKRIWITTALFVLAALYIPTAVLYSGDYMVPSIAVGVVLLALAVFLSVRLRENSAAAGGYSVDDFQKAERQTKNSLKP